MGQYENLDRSQNSCTSSLFSPCSSEAMQYRRKLHSVNCENENVSLVKIRGECRSELSSMPPCVLQKQLLRVKIPLPRSKVWETGKRFLQDLTLNRHVHIVLSQKEISLSTQSSALCDLVGAGQNKLCVVEPSPRGQKQGTSILSSLTRAERKTSRSNNLMNAM